MFKISSKHSIVILNYLLGPALPELSPTPVPLTYERLNATAVKVRVRVPRVLDGRTGFFKVYHSAGLE